MVASAALETEDGIGWGRGGQTISTVGVLGILDIINRSPLSRHITLIRVCRVLGLFFNLSSSCWSLLGAGITMCGHTDIG